MKKVYQKMRSIPELGIGLVIIIVLALIAIFADDLTQYDYTDLLDDVLFPPSSTYPFGTDGLGRDIYSLVIQGTRTSLSIGLIAAGISTIIGVLVGSISAYCGGWLDWLVSEIINIFMMTPSFFLIIIVVALYGSSLLNIVLVIALTSWTGTARMMRSQVLALKERVFIKSLRTLGESHWRILFCHIIPNGIYPIITDATTSISSAILYESSLSFIGLGDPSKPSWGRIIYMGKSYLLSAWWISLFGGLFLVMTVYAFHLIAEGLNQLNNPLRKAH